MLQGKILSCPVNRNQLAKQAKKKIKVPISAPIEAPPPDQASWKTYYPIGITILFFILSFIGILHHEMWRDEYQAWMVAADAHSLPQLFQNLKYEGNPPLWHLFLYVITSLTNNPFWMQVFHILVSTSFIFLFNRFSPFPLLQKFLFTFGYFSFFEFNLISRGYGLGLLLIILFCILYEQRQKYIFYIALVLFLLANNTIFGVILTVSFSGIIVLENLFPDKKTKTPVISLGRLAVFIFIVSVGTIIGYLLIRPEPDNSFPTLYVTGFDVVRLKYTLSRFIYAYFSFPDFSTIHFWNSNFFIPNPKDFPFGLTTSLFIIWIIAFMRYRLITLMYIGGTLILLAFHYYTGLMWNRYAGHLYLLVIVSCWLIYYGKEKPFKNIFLNKVSLIGNKIRTPFFVLLLVIHFCGGVVSYIMDLNYPFSTSSKAADYIRNNHLMDYEIIGSKDFIISPLATQLNKKILYAERREYGSFIIYDQKRNNIWSFKQVEDFVRDMIAKGNKRIILVKDVPVLMKFNDNGETKEWDEGMLTDSIFLKHLTSIPPGIVDDEKYYIYIVEKVK